jgi:hypothetical protein
MQKVQDITFLHYHHPLCGCDHRSRIKQRGSYYIQI